MSRYFDFFRFRSRPIVAAAAVCFLIGTANGQKVDKEKLDTGTRRAAKATKVLTDLAALPASASIPSELLAKARVIAVFPEVTKVNVLFQKGMKGYGLISRRVEGGWGVPAYFGFGVSDNGWTKVKSSSPGVIVLFLDDAALKAFGKDHIAIAGAGEGPVGESISEADRKKISDESMLLYALGDDGLKGISVADDDSAMSGIGMDNNINKAMFGLKGQDVFWGKTELPGAVPKEIADFQKALVALSK